MMPTATAINISASAPKLDVDDRIHLRFYYRIADNLLKQASVYREEKNIVDLYIILLRFSSLMSETIPFHRDYQALLPKEKSNFRKKLLDAIEELESLKPEVQRLTKEMNIGHVSHHVEQEEISFDLDDTSLEWPPVNKQVSASIDINQLYTRPTNKSNQVSPYSLPIDKQFQKLSLSVPLPKEETRKRHSVLGPTGLQGQWLGPATSSRVNYPRNAELTSTGVSGQSQVGQYSLVEANDNDLGRKESAAESILCLNEWSLPNEKSGSPSSDSKWEDSIQSNNIQQLPPPPVLAQVNNIQHPPPPVLPQVNNIHQHPPPSVIAPVNNIQQHCPPVLGYVNNIYQPSPPPVLAHINNIQQPLSPPVLAHVKDPIPPSKVADPRPGPVRPLDEIPDSNTYQHLYISPKMMEDFLRIAQMNTAKNLETCGVLAGSLRNRKFFITTLIIPKQESTSDSCQTMNEEEIFDLQDKLSLFPLGWIHTHPTQSCFMSSIDLHTHYSYQMGQLSCSGKVCIGHKEGLLTQTEQHIDAILACATRDPEASLSAVMLPEAIAIVMAPTDTTRTYGIFHLSDPAGVSLIRNCQERGFHPHEQAEDGSSIYEHCSHVYMHPKLNFEVVDLR